MAIGSLFLESPFKEGDEKALVVKSRMCHKHTRAGEGGPSLAFCSARGNYLFDLVFCRETLFFLQGPAKILNGNKRSIEMEANLPKCTQLGPEVLSKHPGG